MTGKISPSQLSRRAYVYVRQSTASQVFNNRESTKRQYALADRAAALGWPREAIEVVDEDLGRSGKSADGRPGFARLVDAVAHGQVGAILAVEVSRLARSSHDWHRLLSLCSVAETLVIDESAVYDAGNKDDKLLLDIKGTMSEAELHWLGLRLYGARQSKARRGELRLPPPTGYVWGNGRFVLDPDETIQRAVRLVFKRFLVEPSAQGVARWARDSGLSFPTKRHYADGSSEVEWRPLAVSRIYELLHNPTYAGVYTFGRRATRKVLVDGNIRVVRDTGLDPEAWPVRIDNAHAGYITWGTYMSNQRKLSKNRIARGTPGAPKSGKSMLAGLLICGRCGARMETHYGSSGRLLPYYFCRGTFDHTQKKCWTVPAVTIDAAVEELFLETMVPRELEMSLAVEHEVSSQSNALNEHWRTRIEQAEYESQRAERRYKAVDPDNRVVARTLERQWEEALTELEHLRQQQGEAKREARLELTDVDRDRIRTLARDLPKVWRSSPPADRKAMLRLVIEAISLVPLDLPERSTQVRVAWKGGAVTELRTARPDRRERLRTPPYCRDRMNELAREGLHDTEIADRLNAEGLRTGRDKAWTCTSVRWARRREGIERVAPDRPRTERLPARDAQGRYSIAGAAAHYGVKPDVVRRWVKKGVIEACQELSETKGPARLVWWLTVDEASEARLVELARRSRQRTAKLAVSRT